MSITVGILGAGQLAQMLSVAARHLHLNTLCLAKDETCCAALVSDVVIDPHRDATLWNEFCKKVDLVTLETENIPLDLAETIQEQKPLLPNLRTLATSQDRGHEKSTFRALGIPTADYRLIDSRVDLSQAVDALGLPAVLKTRRFGYDGKGQFVLREPQDLDLAWNTLEGQPLILESFIPFETEVSLVGARSVHGDMAFYPLVENTHHQGILHQTVAPYWNDALSESAKVIMVKLMNHLDYHGVMAIEFFVKGGELIANEMAPRVHNTGHWTIEGASVSQFEQHLRAITGLPLKAVHLKGTSVMINCIGTLPDKQAVAKVPHAFYHTYGKALAPGRKVGHITIVHPNRTEALKLADKIKGL